MTKPLLCVGLIALIMLAGSHSPAMAQAGPYDQAKSLTLAADIEGVRIDMPLADARTRLASAGYVTPPAPTPNTPAPNAPRPAASASNLNLPAGSIRPVLATVAVDAQGRFDLRNNSGWIHALADLQGYYG